MCKYMMRQVVPARETRGLPIRLSCKITGDASAKIVVFTPAVRGLIGAFILGDSALAHHSFSMFEYGSSTEIEGTVQEFKYINPHAFIILKVKGKDGRLETWSLEGEPPAMLEREGWNSRTLKPGDQIKATIAPLRSGATGGSWTPQELRFRNGKAVAVSR